MIFEKINLVEWIKYCINSKSLDDEHDAIFNSLTISENKKKILLLGIFVKRAYLAIRKFGEEKESVKQVIEWYESFLKEFNSFEKQLIEDENKLRFLSSKLGLPNWELDPMNNITFGQFIDSKMIVQGNKDGLEWQSIQYIASIYILKGPRGGKIKYHPIFTNEQSKEFKRAGKLNVLDSLIIKIWWHKFNEFVNDNFTVFQESGDIIENTENVDQHMQRWGWVNFLANIAKTKIFDIAGIGKNSIDCVRETNCQEVLIYSSQEKDYNIAQFRDMKIK